MSGYTMTQPELLYTLNAPVTKNTYTTEAAFTGVAGTTAICSLPPGYFALDNPDPVGRALHWEVFGTIATTSAATFICNLGIDTTPGTKLTGANTAVRGVVAPTAAITAPWHFDCWITCTAFTTSLVTVQVNGTWREESVGSGGTPTAGGLGSGFTASFTVLDPRVQWYLELFGTWSASAAGNTTTVQQMFLWGLN